MTYWFTRKPGQFVHESIEDEDPRVDEPALLIGDGTPEWVRLPPDLGGTRQRVSRAFEGECPKCRSHVVRHLELEGCDISVAECLRSGFIWYRTPKEGQ